MSLIEYRAGIPGSSFVRILPTTACLWIQPGDLEASRAAAMTPHQALQSSIFSRAI
jgi:hypothetical protein